MRQEAPPGRGASLVKALPFRSEQLSVTPTTSRSMVAPYRMERTGLEPATPCLQSIYKEDECAQLAHFPGEDAHIFAHPTPRTRILHRNVSVIVSVLDAWWTDRHRRRKRNDLHHRWPQASSRGQLTLSV